jgi:hypothetical protein
VGDLLVKVAHIFIVSSPPSVGTNKIQNDSAIQPRFEPSGSGPAACCFSPFPDSDHQLLHKIHAID